MYAKSLVFIIAMVLSLSFVPVAQSWTDSNSLTNINTSDSSNGSAVVISKEESIPGSGYVHMKYVFLDQNCGPQVVDYYGPRIDPSELQQVDQRMCTEIAMNTRDGD